MEKYYYLYQINNLINGKIYIGVHRTNNLEDGYMGSGIRVLEAQKKYGKENFEKIILEFFQDEEEMFVKEAEIVNSSFILREDVYNITEGGRGSGIQAAKKGGRKGSEVSREKETQKGSRNSQYGTCVIYRFENNVKFKKRIKKEDLNKFLRDGWLKVDHSPPDRFCSKCNTKLSYRNKSGLCKLCNPRLKRFRDKLR